MIIEAITMCLTFSPKAPTSPYDIMGWVVPPTLLLSFVGGFLTLNCSTIISSSSQKVRNHLPRSYLVFDLVWPGYNITFVVRIHFHFSWLHTNYHRLGEAWFKVLP
jgi:hypothetical protein